MKKIVKNYEMVNFLHELSSKKELIKKKMENKLKLKPEYINNYVEENMFETFRNNIPWLNKDAPRDECFMSLIPLEYTYGNGFTRTYKSIAITNEVKYLMDKINYDFNTDYDVCFLNYYKSDKEHLGWHSDDSPEMDNNHPICVLSFGAERYIWCKLKGIKGNIPDNDKYLLNNGSLFIMPSGFQTFHLHKIPKHNMPCGGRISLTFRKYKI